MTFVVDFVNDLNSIAKIRTHTISELVTSKSEKVGLALKEVVELDLSRRTRPGYATSPTHKDYR